jgi:hypothetical protein
MHADRLAIPGIGLAMPRGQGRQEALVDAPSSGLYDPAGHWRRTRRLVPPASGHHPPFGHAVQPTDPSSAAKDPAGHGVHCARAVSLLARAAGQAVVDAARTEGRHARADGARVGQGEPRLVAVVALQTALAVGGVGNVVSVADGALWTAVGTSGEVGAVAGPRDGAGDRRPRAERAIPVERCTC